MKRKKRYSKVFSDGEILEIQQKAIESSEYYLQNREEKRQLLLELLKEKGLENFAWWLAGILESYKEFEFAPNPLYYPKLKEGLEQVRKKGWPVDGLLGSRVGTWGLKQRFRLELPLDANLKEFQPAMQVFQDYFLSLVGANRIAEYIADKHGNGYTYKDLANELNKEVIAWANNENSYLDILGLDDFLRERGYSPEHYELYDEERVRRLVKYYWTQK